MFVEIGSLMVVLHSVEEVAKRKEISMTQVALAWLMTKDPVAAPIVGTTSLEHLDDMISTSNYQIEQDWKITHW